MGPLVSCLRRRIGLYHKHPLHPQGVKRRKKIVGFQNPLPEFRMLFSLYYYYTSE